MTTLNRRRQTDGSVVAARRQGTDDELHARLRQQAIVAELGQRALAGVDLQALMDEAATAVSKTLAVEYCKILELLPDGQQLLLRAGAGWRRGCVGRTRVGAGTGSHAGYTLLSAEPVIVRDLRTETRFHAPPLLHDHGVVSGLSVIIQGVSHDGAFGVLGAHTSTPRTFTEDDINFIQAIANILATAIQRKRTEEALQFQKTLLECQGEASIEGILVVSSEGRMISFNRRFVEMWGIPDEVVAGRSDEAALQSVEDKLVNPDEFLERVAYLYEHPDEESHDELPLKDGRIFDRYSAPVRSGDGAYHGRVWYFRDVTEQRRAEEELRESEFRYRQLLEALSVAVYTTDAEGRLTMFNEAAAVLWGRRPELGKERWCGSWRLYSADGMPMPLDRCPMALTIKENRPVRGQEIIAERPDGSRAYLLPHPTPLRDASGKLTGAVNVLVDITARRQAEEALRLSEERLRLAMESGGMGVWEWDIKTGQVDWSESLERIHGLAPGTFGRTFNDYLNDIHPDDRERVVGDARDSVERGVHDIEYRIVRPDGAVRWVVGKGQVVYEDGKPARMTGVCMDITDRKQAEAALRLSELRFRSLFEYNVDAVFSFDASGRFTSANPACERMTAFSEDELIGKSFTDLIVPEELEEVLDHFTRAVQGEPQYFESAMQNRYGKRLEVSVTGVPIVLGGKTTGVFGIAKEITERKRAERRQRLLAEAGAVLAASLDFEAVPRRLGDLIVARMADWCAIDVVEEDATIRRVVVSHSDPTKEDIARKLQQYTPEPSDIEALRESLLRGESRLYPDLSDEQLAAAAQNEEHLRIMRELGFTSAMIVPLITRGRLQGAITFVYAESGRRYTPEDRDLAEDLARRAALAIDNARLYRQAHSVQAELRKANEAKDEFLGLISHELRTPITTIYGGARLLRFRTNELDEESKTAVLSDIEQETERLHRIVEDLLVLSRLELDQRVPTEPVLLQHLIDKVAQNTMRRQPQRRVEVRIEGQLDPVAAEPTYLEQVLRNLLSNADKYSPIDKTVEILARQQGSRVQVSILDRGPGVPPNEAERIFERFYRSQHSSHKVGGAGIGLTVSKRLVEAQSGRIWARPRKGGGLEVSFSLPVFGEEAM